MRTFALSLCLATAATACGGGDDGHDHDHDVDASTTDAPDAGPASVETRSLTLNSGMFAEASFTAGPGDHVVVELSADMPVIAWNIHGHVGGGTQTIVEGDSLDAVTYDFQPTDDVEWFLLVGNSDDTPRSIDVTLSFYGDAAFGQWL